MTNTEVSYTLQELAILLRARLEGDPSHRISAVADLESAEACEVTFLANPRYEGLVEKTKAGAIVMASTQARITGKNYLLSDEPSRTFQELIELFMKDAAPMTGFTGIDPTAVIHPTAVVHTGVTLCPYVVVDAHAIIGAGTYVGAHTAIAPKVIIGENCTIHANVVIREGCHIGNRVVIQPGAIIGSCGFGFTTDANGVHTKLNQLGNVIVEDDVEIGANTTIDRSRFQSTRIGKGTKIDNLVQIGHGVKLGPYNLIIGQTGIAGSTETGSHVVLAGQVGVNGHIKLADGVMVAARSGVTKSLLKPGKYGGMPAIPLHEHNKIAVLQNNIERYVEELKELRKQLEELSRRGN